MYRTLIGKVLINCVVTYIFKKEQISHYPTCKEYVNISFYTSKYF